MPAAFRPGFNGDINDPVAKDKPVRVGTAARVFVPAQDIPIFRSGEPSQETLKGLRSRINAPRLAMGPAAPSVAAGVIVPPALAEKTEQSLQAVRVFGSRVFGGFDAGRVPPISELDLKLPDFINESILEVSVLIASGVGSVCAAASGAPGKYGKLAKLCAIGSQAAKAQLKSGKNPVSANAAKEAKKIAAQQRAANDNIIRDARLIVRNAKAKASRIKKELTRIFRGGEPKKSAVKKPPPPGVGLKEVLLVILGVAGLRAGAGLIKGKLFPSKAGSIALPSPAPAPSPVTVPSIVPTFDPVRESLRQQRLLISNALAGAPNISLGQIAGEGLRTRFGSLTAARTQTAAARRCVERGSRRRKAGRCEEGFYKESRSRTRHVVWRTFDCRTGKTLSESK